MVSASQNTIALQVVNSNSSLCYLEGLVPNPMACHVLDMGQKITDSSERNEHGDMASLEDIWKFSVKRVHFWNRYIFGHTRHGMRCQVPPSKL